MRPTLVVSHPILIYLRGIAGICRHLALARVCVPEANRPAALAVAHRQNPAQTHCPYWPGSV